MEENTKKKNTKKKIIITLIVLAVIIFIVIPLIPFLIFVVVVLWEMFVAVPAEPTIKQAEFPFEVVYEYKGEVRTIKDTVVFEYEGHSFALDGGNTRDWTITYKNNTEDAPVYYVEEGNEDFYIIVEMEPEYYMGAPDYNWEPSKPIISYADYENDIYYREETEIKEIGIKILEWKPASPINNEYK